MKKIFLPLFFVVLAVFGIYLSSENNANEKLEGINLKWIKAKIICPDTDDVESIVLLNQKGYLPAFYLRNDGDLLHHLQSTNKDIVKLVVRYEGKNDDGDLIMYLVSLEDYKIDNSWLLGQNSKGCLLGEILGHK